MEKLSVAQARQPESVGRQIELDGSVGPIGGIVQKTVGVRRSGIDVFLVPVDNARQARSHAGKMRVIPVRNFQQALHALATLPQKG